MVCKFPNLFFSNISTDGEREGRAGPGALLAISHGHTATVRHDWGGREGQSELFSQINSMFKEISEIVLKVLNNFLTISN